MTGEESSRWLDRRSLLAGLGALGAGCAGLEDGGSDEAGGDDGSDETGGDDGSDGASVSHETVEPAFSDERFDNPGRGWVLNGWADDYRDAEAVLDYGSVGYSRLDWSWVQPHQDGFNWDPIDRFLEGWDELGLTAAFGIHAANSHAPDEHRFQTPEWVFDDGAEYKVVEIEEDMNYAGTPGRKVVPKFDDPVFLDHLETLQQAVADRYDGDDRVEFVDILSYGNWGEVHMWPFDHIDPDMYEPLSVEEFRRHVEIHTEAFDETQLLIASKGADHEHAAVDEWALEHGVGLRRNGVVAGSDGSETERALGKEPAAFEWHGNYEWLVEQGYWDGSDDDPDAGFPLEDCVDRGHPSYVGFNHFDGAAGARRFLEAEPELIERLSRKIGYRLELVEASVPTTLPGGTDAEVEVTWRNAGVAPPYVADDVALAVVDDGDEVLDRQSLGLDPADWPHDEAVESTATVAFEDLSAGEHRLAIGAFTDRDRDAPDVRLAIDGERVDRWHVLGPIEVT